MADWPSELQQYLNRESFRRQRQDTNITSEVETGPRKVRRRFTNAQTYLRATIWVHQDDFNILEDFYVIDLADGTGTFDFDDPTTGETKQFRFTQPYQANALGGVYFRVTMDWESV